MTRSSLPFLAIDVAILIVRAFKKWVSELFSCSPSARRRKGAVRRGIIGTDVEVGAGGPDGGEGEKGHGREDPSSDAKMLGEGETQMMDVDDARSMVGSIASGAASEVSRANSELKHFGFSKSLAAILTRPKAALQSRSAQ